MSFDWEEYLKLAKELAGEHTSPSNTEAKRRASISRAYYAVFHKALEFIQRIETFPSNQKDIHNEIKKWFYTKSYNLKDDRLRIIGVQFDILKNDRRDADYETIFPKFNNNKATDVIISSEDTIKRLRDYSSQIRP